MKYIPREKTKRKRIFTDKEYLKLYNQGMSDNQIRKIFKCSYSSVRLRRLRLHLVANYTNLAGEVNNVEKLKDEEKRISERIIKKQKLPSYKEKNKKHRSTPKFKAYMKKLGEEYNKKPEIKNRRLENSRKPERKIKSKQYYEKNKDKIMEKEKQRLSKPEFRQKRRKYLKKYNRKPEVKKKKKKYVENNREKIREYHREWYEKNKERISLRKKEEYKRKKILSNSSPPVRTSNSTSLTSDKPKGFNMGLEVPTSSPPKSPSATSPNPNIKSNSHKETGASKN